MDQKRKKILFVITKSNWGGAQKYVYDLATSLPKESYDVAVVFGGKGPLADKLAAAGVRTVSIKSLQRDVTVFGDAASLFRLLSIFRKEKPDIVHVNSSKVGGLGAFAARAMGVPRIIFTCHGWPFNEDRSALSLLAINFFSWLTVAFSHTTITVSERDLSDGRKMAFVGHKMTLVHNGVRVPEFKDALRGRRYMTELAHAKGVEIAPDDILIGAMGELHKNKGYEYLIEAFAELAMDFDKPAKLVIMGEGEERASLISLIQKFRVEKQVALVGFVKESPTYLKAFDAFVLSSIKEGLPYVVIEAGFAALPVVATNVGGVREIIDDMQSGILVQTRKPADIAQGLHMVLDERARAAAFGKALEEKVRAKFSIELMVKNTVAVYEKK
ncbi:MAG TPA: glycosyltransferase family 4 protein [Candidatus Paceibacterota bacterium]